MDNKFDRISREPLVMGGQARIRDTNITVNEIVRLSLEGTSQADILAKYPETKAEDVHQALGYAMQTVNWGLGRWRSDTISPMVATKGFAEILAGKYPISKNDKQAQLMLEQAPKIIINAAKRAIGYTKHMPLWFRLQFEYPNHPIWQTTVTELLYEVNSTVLELEPDADISYLVSSDDVQINDAGYLMLAIVYLLIGGYEFSKKAQLNIQVDANRINFCITRTIENNKFSIERSDFSYAGFFEAANLIIFQNGSELGVREDKGKVIFEFELPIWKEEQD